VGLKKDALPPLVKAMATFVMTRPAGTLAPGVEKLFQDRREKAERLLKMNGFWSKLARRRVHDSNVDKHWALWNAKLGIPDESASQGEKAAALLFNAAVYIFSTPRVVTLKDGDGAEFEEILVWKRAEVEEKAGSLRIAAEQCRAALRHQPRVTKWGAKLADALLMAAEYFEKQYEFNVRSPFIVERFGPRDETRTRVVQLATEMQRVYGTSSYGTTAKIASAALADNTIGLTTAREWCEGLHREVNTTPLA
jgi:hypothetical protein